MNENIELLKYIYESSEMGTATLTDLLRELNKKKNKLNKIVENELKCYEYFLKNSQELLNNYDACGSKKKSLGAKIGIKMEIMKDNSDANVAHMLIQGLTMGVVDMNSKIDNYQKCVDKKNLDLAKKYLVFQETEIENLKKYL